MTYRIAEPLLTFYEAIQRPDWAEWERARDPKRLWQRRSHRFDSNVMGPHFEQICRTWITDYSPPELFGGYVTRAGSGTVNDPARKTSHEVDIAIFGELPEGHEALLAIGAAKWNDVMGQGHLDRLAHIRQLLSGKFDTTHTRIACFSGAGFMPGVIERANADDVMLVGLDDLYGRARLPSG